MAALRVGARWLTKYGGEENAKREKSRDWGSHHSFAASNEFARSANGHTGAIGSTNSARANCRFSIGVVHGPGFRADTFHLSFGPGRSDYDSGPGAGRSYEPALSRRSGGLRQHAHARAGQSRWLNYW